MKNIFLIALLFLSSCSEQKTPKTTSPSARKCFLAKSVKYVIDLKGTVIKSKGKRYKIKLDPSLKGQAFMLKEGVRLENKPDPKDHTKTIITCQYEAYHRDKPDVMIGKVKVLGQKVAQK